MIYSFKNDYSEGAHPDILTMLHRTNAQQHDGYGGDGFYQKAVGLIKDQVENPRSEVHFVSGGTQANAIVISAVLKPYEAVITADTGHINVHEAGAIESHGHKVLSVESQDGKLDCQGIASVLEMHTDEHMVKPRLVYLSNTTETGTIYTKKELQEIARFCRGKRLYVYMDGARIGSAMTARHNDMKIRDIGECTDIFYIGGTKNGALLGEAIVINNDLFKDNFRYHIKQHGALLSKSRVFSLQFYALFKDGLFFRLAEHANQMADRLAEGIKENGYHFLTPPQTNQIFPILPNRVIDSLSEKFKFYVWQKTGEDSSAIRLVTSWATKQDAVDRFIAQLS